MATPVIMPRQGQSVESCILTQWYKNVGDSVEKGELLFAYETDKAAFEEEAAEEGMLLSRFYEEGDEVPVLSNVAVIGKEGEKADEFLPESEKKKGSSGPETQAEEASEPANKGDSMQPSESVQEVGRNPDEMIVEHRGPVKISPRARKLAREKRISYDSIKGSGPEGRIIERDILEEIKHGKRLTPLAEKKMKEDGLGLPAQGKSPYGKITSKDLVEPGKGSEAVTEGLYTDQPLSNLRKLVAGAMHRSLQNSAQLTHHLSANASKMLRLRKVVKAKMNEGYASNITLNDMVCYAVINALKNHAGANAHFLGEAVRIFHKVNLGLAVDTERGLLVPALPNADDYSLPGLSSQLKTLADSAKKGNINPDLLDPSAASFTVSNLGNYGVEMFTPVINLPQVAILGVNTIIQRPTVLEDGSFGFQPFIGLSLTYDHRALDGGPATLFLSDIKNEIEKLSDDLL